MERGLGESDWWRGAWDRVTGEEGFGRTYHKEDGRLVTWYLFKELLLKAKLMSISVLSKSTMMMFKCGSRVSS